MQRKGGISNSWEVYSGLLSRAPLVARADGRGFKKVLEEMKKPYDQHFAECIAGASKSFFLDSGLSPALAFTFSDEVSILFLEAPFGGRVEKIDSLIAGFLSSALSLGLQRIVSMDCRTIPLCPSEIEQYLALRQDEAWRNHVFSYGFYGLVQEGCSTTEAMRRLQGLSESEIHELLFSKGVNLAKTPSWQRRGAMIYRRDGVVQIDWQIPLFSSGEGRELLARILDRKA